LVVLKQKDRISVSLLSCIKVAFAVTYVRHQYLVDTSALTITDSMRICRDSLFRSTSTDAVRAQGLVAGPFCTQHIDHRFPSKYTSPLVSKRPVSQLSVDGFGSLALARPTQTQAAALREGRWADLDIEN
jgi:hypothetical protein